MEERWKGGLEVLEKQVGGWWLRSDEGGIYSGSEVTGKYKRRKRKKGETREK